jgi:hypothetical protein
MDELQPELRALLHPAVAAKDDRIVWSAIGANHSANEAADRRNEAIQNLTRIRNETKRQLVQARNETDDEYRTRADKIRRRLDETENAVRRLKDGANAAHAAWEALYYREDDHRWLQSWYGMNRRAGGVRTLVHVPVKVKPAADYNPIIIEVRRQIDEVVGSIQQIERAPLPADEVRRRATIEIDRLADAAAPKVRLRGSQNFYGEIIDLHPYNPNLLFFVGRDILMAHVEAEIARADFTGAMTDDRREAAVSKAMAEKLQLERTEEALIVASEELGRPIQRRRGHDPRAYWQVEERDA